MEARPAPPPLASAPLRHLAITMLGHVVALAVVGVSALLLWRLDENHSLFVVLGVIFAVMVSYLVFWFLVIPRDMWAARKLVARGAPRELFLVKRTEAVPGEDSPDYRHFADLHEGGRDGARRATITLDASYFLPEWIRAVPDVPVTVYGLEGSGPLVISVSRALALVAPGRYVARSSS